MRYDNQMRGIQIIYQVHVRSDGDGDGDGIKVLNQLIKFTYFLEEVNEER